MDSIVGVFPDSCIVQTHRDPAEVIASYCSLIATSHRVVSRRVDLHQIGRRAVKHWADAVNRSMRARDRLDPRHFYDVQYEDLLRDPAGVTRGVYEYFGYPFVPAHEAKMVAWLSQNPQNKHGAHRYALEQFGLDRETVRREFAEYICRCGL
jgi:hypothetical protein